MKKMFRSKMIVTAFTLAIGAISFQAAAESTSSTSTDNRPPPHSGGRPPAPPAEALQACAGKASGAACSFTGREGTAISGQCFGPPPNMPGNAGAPGASNNNGNTSANASTAAPLACRPERGNGAPPPPPPADK